MTPTEATLLTALPEIIPNRLDATTAILAAPPRRLPISADAMSVNHSRGAGLQQKLAEKDEHHHDGADDRHRDAEHRGRIDGDIADRS